MKRLYIIQVKTILGIIISLLLLLTAMTSAELLFSDKFDSTDLRYTTSEAENQSFEMLIDSVSVQTIPPEDETIQHRVSEIFIATFGRAPAYAGLTYWTNAVETGVFAIEQVAQSFFDQPETKEKFPDESGHSEFITTIFYNVLNRAPAHAGLTYWVDALDRGEIRRDQAIMAIINGAKAATGDADDAAMLAKKTKIGVSFAKSEIGTSFTDDENFMAWATNIISFAASNDFDLEEAEEYISNLLSDITVQLKLVKSSASYDDSPDYDSADMETLVNGFSDFTFNFYHQASANANLQDKNIFFSTYSIENALAMTWAGAKNNTADEMANSLHLTLPSGKFHSTLNALNMDIDSRDDVAPFSGDAFQLNLVNAVWSRIGYPFLSSYLDILAQNYDAGVQALDFTGQPDASRLVINRWVEDQTNKKIKDLLPEDSISRDTAVVLTNAIYFKASWYSEFDEEATIPGDFTRLDNSTVSSQMMHQTVNTRFFQSEDFDAVELPYVSAHYEEHQYPQELSILLIAPHNGQFNSVESALDNNFIQSILSSLSMGDVELTLPKFEFDCEIRCKQIMRNLGMIAAFNPDEADFSNMVDPEDSTPYIHEIYHKAFIAVDEKGTEAAAATAVVCWLTSTRPEPVSISMDRPFIFLIRDNFTGTILFMGRVIDPSVK